MKKKLTIGTGILIVAAVAGGILLSGIENNNILIDKIENKQVKKIEKIEVSECEGKEVAIGAQFGDNGAIFCGSKSDYAQMKTEIKKRFKENGLKGLDKGEMIPSVTDQATAIMVSLNDEVFADEMITEMLKKYDTNTHKFKGEDFDVDFKEQLAFYVNLADMKCGGCDLDLTKGLNEELYNLLTK